MKRGAKVWNVTGQQSDERQIWFDYEKGPVLGKGYDFSCLRLTGQFLPVSPAFPPLASTPYLAPRRPSPGKLDPGNDCFTAEFASITCGAEAPTANHVRVHSLPVSSPDVR